MPAIPINTIDIAFQIGYNKKVTEKQKERKNAFPRQKAAAERLPFSIRKYTKTEEDKMLNTLYNIMISGSVLGHFLQVVPITCLAGLIYILFRWLHSKKQETPVKWCREILQGLFVCYLVGLFNLVLVPANFWTYIWATVFTGYSHNSLTFFSGEFNLIPSLFRWVTGELTMGSWMIKMLVYNFLMFLPFGFFLSVLSEKVNRKNIWIIAAAVPLSVELLQPIVGRSFDIDDLILNFAGIIAGYFLTAGIKTLIQKKQSA